MRRFISLLVFVTLIIDAYAEEITGSIIFVSGKEYSTKIKGTKDWITNTTDSQLKSGLRLKTDENTSLRVLLENRFVIFVPPDSNVNFTKLTDTKEIITILKGDILIDASMSKVKGIVNTPTAEIVRDRPASLIVSVNAQDGATEVIVIEQEVSVKNIIQPDNNYKVVRQGTYCKVLPQILPTEPSQFRENDIKDRLERIKTPISTADVRMQEEDIFDRFIEEFHLDLFFDRGKDAPSPPKRLYTSPNIPVDFDRNLISRSTNLIINIE